MSGQACSWCGEAVDLGDGFRAGEPAGAREAVFCRLEHVVPWVIQGAHWSPASDSAAAAATGTGDAEDGMCAECGVPAGAAQVVLVRHRGEHRITDRFCGTAHLLAWAKAGGRYRG